MHDTMTQSYLETFYVENQAKTAISSESDNKDSVISETQKRRSDECEYLSPPPSSSALSEHVCQNSAIKSFRETRDTVEMYFQTEISTEKGRPELCV